MSEHLSLQQAADEISVNPWTVWRLVRDGAIPAIRIGRIYRIARPDWETFKKGSAFKAARSCALVAREGELLIDRIVGGSR